MQALIIKGSKRTPTVVLDKTTGKFIISGYSLPENVSLFYKPVLEWMNQYILNPNSTTILTFELAYFNSTSSKVFLEMIFMIQNLLNNGLDARINWCFNEDDDDILEAGEIFKSLSKVPFEFIINN